MRAFCSSTCLGVANPAPRISHLEVKQRYRVYAVPYKGCVPPHRLVLGPLDPALAGGVCRFSQNRPPKGAA
jgi:hypothetical protein